MLRDEERVLHAIQFLLSIRFILNVRPLLCINISLRRLQIAKEVDNIEDVLLSLEQKSLIGKGKTLNYDYYIVKNNSKSKVMEHFEKAIKEYLDDLAKKDKLFAEKYANKDKSIKDCCNFIVGEIKKMADKKNMIGCTDDVVYGLAIHYYDEEFDKPATPVSCKVVKIGRAHV